MIGKIVREVFASRVKVPYFPPHLLRDLSAHFKRGRGGGREKEARETVKIRITFLLLNLHKVWERQLLLSSTANPRKVSTFFLSIFPSPRLSPAILLSLFSRKPRAHFRTYWVGPGTSFKSLKFFIITRKVEDTRSFKKNQRMINTWIKVCSTNWLVNHSIALLSAKWSIFSTYRSFSLIIFKYNYH